MEGYVVYLKVDRNEEEAFLDEPRTVFLKAGGLKVYLYEDSDVRASHSPCSLLLFSPPLSRARALSLLMPFSSFLRRLMLSSRYFAVLSLCAPCCVRLVCVCVCVFVRVCVRACVQSESYMDSVLMRNCRVGADKFRHTFFVLDDVSTGLQHRCSILALPPPCAG